METPPIQTSFGVMGMSIKFRSPTAALGILLTLSKYVLILLWGSLCKITPSWRVRGAQNVSIGG